MIITKNEFIDNALKFKILMHEPRSLDELHNLWRSTSFPYAMDNNDPYSDKYKDEVVSLYESLTSSVYDTSNELTSSLQTESDFLIGYPWISKNLRVVSSEIGKSVYAMKVIGDSKSNAKSFIEFGSGWGNLSIPLARAGFDVTAVDIDPGFIVRLQNEARAINIKINTITAEFNAAIDLLGETKFDCVIFCSSFHHCIHFKELLQRIKDNILAPDGYIFFFSEPISPNFSFPWGIRYDGESIWAVTCNKWLELGFSDDFFKDLMFGLGFNLRELNDPSGEFGRAWIASL